LGERICEELHGTGRNSIQSVSSDSVDSGPLAEPQDQPGNMAKKKTKKKSRRGFLEGTLCLLCDSVAVDPNTKKPTLYGLFDHVWSDSFPLTYKRFSVYAKLRGKGNHAVSVGLQGPGRKITTLNESQLNLRSESIAVLQADIIGLELPSPGQYAVVVRAGRRTLCKAPFTVTRRKKEVKG